MNLTTIEKSNAIRNGVLHIANELNSRDYMASSAAIQMLCDACALLTSTIKDERERGKQMVRHWKTRNDF